MLADEFCNRQRIEERSILRWVRNVPRTVSKSDSNKVLHTAQVHNPGQRHPAGTSPPLWKPSESLQVVHQNGTPFEVPSAPWEWHRGTKYRKQGRSKMIKIVPEEIGKVRSFQRPKIHSWRNIHCLWSMLPSNTTAAWAFSSSLYEERREEDINTLKCFNIT